MSFRNYLWRKIKEYDWSTLSVAVAILLGCVGIIALPTWLSSVIFGNSVIALCSGLLVGLFSTIVVLLLTINYLEYLEQKDTTSNETGKEKK